MGEMGQKKMTKLKALIATEHPDKDGNSLSKEMLDKMAEQATGLPVTFDFRHNQLVGRVVDTVRDENGVTVTVSMRDASALKRAVEELTDRGFLYAAVAGIVEDSHYDAGALVIDEMKLTGIGITMSPADPALTPIVKLEGGNDEQQ